MTLLQISLFSAVMLPLCLACRRQFLHQRLIRAYEGQTRELANFGTMLTRFKAETLDLETEARAAAEALAGFAGAHFVRIGLAIGPESKVRVDANALRAALRALLHTAILASPGGQVLVAAIAKGQQMHLRIVDDGANADQRVREGVAREAESLIALQGGSIAVEARQGRGTMVTIRLPLPGSTSPDTSEPIERPALASQAPRVPLSHSTGGAY